ncbi:MAG: heavy-metal-associated domain-containing protein [Tissierellia bacterium]|nr:heavy-metal-associated domain-containing protein [Tissierellia bacterium]
MKKIYDMEIGCANCANLMQENIAKIDGINEVNINFMMQRMTLSFDDDQNEKKLLKKILKTCRRIEPDCEIDY